MTKTQASENTGLSGQLLIAMPGIGDARFDRAVVLMCQHSAEGAMGLVINRTMPNLSYLELLDQLTLPVTDAISDRPVYAGGPMESGRGFVVHSEDYTLADASRRIGEGLALTANIDILQEMAQGGGPKRSLVCLGYAGWSPGQLDQEVAGNVWLQVPASATLVFATPNDQKWPKALATLGIDVAMLSQQAGHA
jgi:putative transcriptional regulator